MSVVPVRVARAQTCLNYGAGRAIRLECHLDALVRLLPAQYIRHCVVHNLYSS
jgi:hypothetical protein